MNFDAVIFIEGAVRTLFWAVGFVIALRCTRLEFTEQLKVFFVLGFAVATVASTGMMLFNSGIIDHNRQVLIMLGALGTPAAGCFAASIWLFERSTLGKLGAPKKER